MLVIVAFQGPYNLSFDYPKESKGKPAFSSWLVTTQSWKCSVTAAYSSGAPVIAIFECQIRETLTFYHERGQNHKPAQNCKIPTWLEHSLPKMSLQCGHPTHPNLTILRSHNVTAGWRGGAPPACSPGYTKGLPGQNMQFPLPYILCIKVCVSVMWLKHYVYIYMYVCIRKQAQQQCIIL